MIFFDFKVELHNSLLSCMSRGYTLIEMIIVIAIIGILAITAIPQFINLSATSEKATINNIAGTLSSANAENYASRIVSTANGSPVTNCTSIGNLLQGGLPSGYTISAKNVKVNSTVNCTLRGHSLKATFLATGIL